jgi:serine/threonine protein kinase
VTDGWWKLADLGLTSNGTEGNRVTETGRGKISYRAPELVNSEEKIYSKKTDTWSLGCIFYDMCVGKRAFHSDVTAYEYAIKKERLEIETEFPPILRCNVGQITLATWIREMLDWDPARRRTAEELGKDFWKLLSLLVTPSTFSAMETNWRNTDLLSPDNLLSTDVPSDNQLMMKEVPPRWEHVLFQGACYSHNMKTLARAKQVVTTREILLGESHRLTMHSRVRLAWTSFYLGTSDIANPSDEFKKLLELKPPHEHSDREVVSYLAGVGWSERLAGNYDESSQNFEKALDIQHQCNRSTDTDTLAYTVALADVHFTQALNMKKTSRKRKRSGNDDQISARSLAEDALFQIYLSYNSQCLNLQLGRGHPDSVETMKLLAWGHQALAAIKKAEPFSVKSSRQRHADSAELYLNEALELGRNCLGPDHPYTLLTLNEVGHLKLKKGQTEEAIMKLEEAFSKQKYVLGIDDPETQATIENLQDAYRLCRETRKLRDLTNEVGNKPLKISRRSLRMDDLENGTDNEGDLNRVDHR